MVHAIRRRYVLLGASNLTRACHLLVPALRQAADGPIDISLVHGLGRSYGKTSAFLLRSLPGICDCGVWSALERSPPLETCALVSDIGNDILYDVPVPTILEWVGRTLERLARLKAKVVLTLPPLENLPGLGTARFLCFRTLSHPLCRLSRQTVVERTHALHAGLAALARSMGLTEVPLRPEWYGIDPIHIRRGALRPAWSEILAPFAPSEAAFPIATARAEFGVAWLRPERRWLAGIEQRQLQPVRCWPDGSRLAVY